MRWGIFALFCLAGCVTAAAAPAVLTFANGRQLLLDGRAEFAIISRGGGGRGNQWGDSLHLYELPLGAGRTRIIAYREQPDVWADSESCPALKDLAVAVRSARQPVNPPGSDVVICTADCGSPPGIVFNAEQGAIFKPGLVIKDIYSREDPASRLFDQANALDGCWGSRAGFTHFDG